VLIGQKKEFVSWLGVLQADAAREARLRIGGHPHYPQGRKLLTGQRKQMGELSR
jgi:hypothetical protein